MSLHHLLETKMASMEDEIGAAADSALGGGAPKTTGTVWGGITPGIYNADGDPWTYLVGAGGDVFAYGADGEIKKTSGGAKDAIIKAIQKGQLSEKVVPEADNPEEVISEPSMEEKSSELNKQIRDTPMDSEKVSIKPPESPDPMDAEKESMASKSSELNDELSNLGSAPKSFVSLKEEDPMAKEQESMASKSSDLNKTIKELSGKPKKYASLKDATEGAASMALGESDEDDMGDEEEDEDEAEAKKEKRPSSAKEF